MLLAYQFLERDPDGSPSMKARLGATWLAEQHLMQRAFLRGPKRG